MADGAVDSDDLDEAEIYLNGTVIGVEVIEGHGPNNTEAIVGSFIARAMAPTITLTVTSAEGVLAQVDQIVRQFFKPHSRDENEAFRWQFGGEVPIAILFGLLWAGVPNRVTIGISVAATGGPYGIGDPSISRVRAARAFRHLRSPR